MLRVGDRIFKTVSGFVWGEPNDIWLEVTADNLETCELLLRCWGWLRVGK